ncbi:MAG: cell division protein FtsH, partial [Ignavibacteriaceae bacterium]
MAKLAITLGGRASEKIVFDDYSNGAASDFKAVTNLARKMVCLWGMSDKLGPVYYRQGEDHLFLGKEIAQSKNFSEHTQQIIDEEIEKIIKESEERAITLLKDNRVKLDALAEGLLENETMDRDQINWLLDKVEKGEEVEA